MVLEPKWFDHSRSANIGWPFQPTKQEPQEPWIKHNDFTEIATVLETTAERVSDQWVKLRKRFIDERSHDRKKKIWAPLDEGAIFKKYTLMEWWSPWCFWTKQTRELVIKFLRYHFPILPPIFLFLHKTQI